MIQYILVTFEAASPAKEMGKEQSLIIQSKSCFELIAAQ